MKVKAVSRWLLTVSAVGLIAGCCESNCEKIHDVVIYGSSPAALSAAISAQRLGKTVVIVCPETRIGGLTTGGLGQTDIGNKSAFGGLALLRRQTRHVGAAAQVAGDHDPRLVADYQLIIPKEELRKAISDEIAVFESEQQKNM